MRDCVERFEFGAREFDPARGTLTLGFALHGPDLHQDLFERFEFGMVAAHPDRSSSLEAAFELLHWIVGVSYWKVACSGRIGFAGARPDPAQARALEQIYRDGLAELAWRNRLSAPWWPNFKAAAGEPRVPAGSVGLGDRALVAIGGGKDSLVALERVRRAGVEASTVQVGRAALIGQVARASGLNHRVIGRRLAPELAALNLRGALNGHVPITAINAAALVVAALLWDFNAVVFANERSADTPTLITATGLAVNHQFAKSLAFEELFSEWLRRSIATDLDVFSILRRERELGICREFMTLDNYHGIFSSCNRNFHLDGARTERWCRDCPKCRFVFLALAPFADPARLTQIFGADLLADPNQKPGFEALLALDQPRPFECVGEPDEARAAVRALAARRAWSAHPVIMALNRRLDGVEVPPLEALLRPGGRHRIPARFRT